MLSTNKTLNDHSSGLQPEHLQNLNLLIAFDVVKQNGTSLLNGKTNAIELPLALKEVTDYDSTALLLWLRSILWDLFNTELTEWMMPKLTVSKVDAHNSSDTSHQPLLKYRDLRTQISIIHTPAQNHISNHG